jgi:hypothetical protein
MITVSVGGLNELSQAVKNMKNGLRINLSTAIAKTAKKTTTFAARELKKTLPVPVRILKKAIRIKSRPTPNRLQATITVNQGYAIPLKYFGAKQLKNGAVTFRVSTAKGSPRRIDRQAFIVKQYGGNVYRRKGKERGPLEQLYGPSPSEAFIAAGLESKVRDFAQKQLPLEIKERIRLALLRNAGLVAKRKGS